MNNQEKIKENKAAEPPHRSPVILGSSLGTELAVAIFLFGGAGYWADKKYGTSPCFLLIGIALSFIYGGYAVWKLVRMMSKPKPKKDENKSNESDT
ncbi:AtpZ/AtpI family protein [Lentisphaera profundi]|uniref:AtpZ/AtpI family protein n=1 Tax=Lentisphaera profundi TaxID=1658616 RepID=A0ABY7VVS9_9BACT|nr:AtpZ/AtpI family protein [Lentisphaera profundi]WDE97879.1 AtpZ/AtpI family protein [Lentisphaera profundi]